MEENNNDNRNFAMMIILLLSIVICILLSMATSTCSHAEEIEETDSASNYVTSGNFTCKYDRTTDTKVYKKVFEFSPSADSANSENSYLYIVKKKNTNATAYYAFGVGSYTEHVTTIVNDELYSEENYTRILSKYTDESMTAVTLLNVNDTYADFIYESNIPVFDSTNVDAITAYEETGDTSGAENADTLSSGKYDETIEKPVNLRTYGDVSNVLGAYDTSGQFTVRWDVPQNQIDSYSYDVQVRACYTKDGKSVWTDWSTEVSAYPYNGHELYDLNTGERVTRSPSLPEDFIVTQSVVYKNIPESSSVVANRYAVSDFDVRVRNRKGSKYSNWVSISVASDSKSVATVTDDNGNVVDDDYYNGQDVNNSDSNTYYDTDYQDGGTSGSLNTDNVSINSILGFIKSGFGLLGDNGIIALMARTFSYIPASVWTIIKFFVSMLVVICVIDVVKEVL